jgi:hypothetical protein
MLGIGRFVRRRWFVLAAVISVSLVAAASASAIGGDISPGSQSVCSGCAVDWVLGWGDVTPYTITFYYGDGNHLSYGPGNATGAQIRNYAFYTCIGQTYQQHLHVHDGTLQTADVYASTFVAKGNIC